MAQQRAKPPLDMDALQRSLRQLLRVQRGKFREADLRAALEENACELGEEDYTRLFQSISDRGRVRLTGEGKVSLCLTHIHQCARLAPA
ncbi:hypothetical protein AAHC03_020 [Spirometra sp. Aus1]